MHWRVFHLSRGKRWLHLHFKSWSGRRQCVNWKQTRLILGRPAGRLRIRTHLSLWLWGWYWRDKQWKISRKSSPELQDVRAPVTKGAPSGMYGVGVSRGGEPLDRGRTTKSAQETGLGFHTSPSDHSCPTTSPLLRFQPTAPSPGGLYPPPFLQTAFAKVIKDLPKLSSSSARLMPLQSLSLEYFVPELPLVSPGWSFPFFFFCFGLFVCLIFLFF